MPSFWDLLCVSRPKYNTHDGRSRYRPRSPLWAAESRSRDAEYYIRPEFHFHCEFYGERHEPPPWYVNDSRGSRENSRSGFILQSSGKLDKRYNGAVPLLNSKAANRKAGQRSERKPVNGRLSQDVACRPKPGVKEEPKLEDRKSQEDITGKRRRHVKDIFPESVQGQDTQCRPLVNTGTPSVTYSSNSYQNRKPLRTPSVAEDSLTWKQAESMYQYSPRSVNDDAVSAALFGNPMDDFIRDPDWNRAIDNFAASPSSNSSFFFGKNGTPSSQISSKRYQPISFFSENVTDIRSELHPLQNLSHVQRDRQNSDQWVVRNADLRLTDLECDSRTQTGNKDIVGDPNSVYDLEQIFSAKGDVLY